MSEMNSILFDIKTRLSGVGINFSDNKFSSHMLSKSPRYISWIRATDHEPALDCMVSLHSRLDDLTEQYTNAGDANTANHISGMAETLWAAIRRASLAQVPKRRPSPIHPSKPKDAAQCQHTSQ